MKPREYDSQPIQKLINKKELIINELRSKGLRITKQRKLIIDIILDEECTCCKEIYYQAHGKDSSIGIATVYRMVKTLEEIGAIDRRNMYRLSYDQDAGIRNGCTILLKSNTTIRLSQEQWAEVLETGLKKKGFLAEDKIEAVLVQ